MAEIAKELEDAASVRTRDDFELPPVDAAGVPLTPAQELTMAAQLTAQRVEEIRSRYTRRMHDLSEFMKYLLERFTKWFNRTHSRSGTLWEDRFKSVIVESGADDSSLHRPQSGAGGICGSGFECFSELRTLDP